MRKVSPKQLRKMMKQMGVREVSSVKVVIIKCNDKEIVVSSPQVVEMKVGGQRVYQVSGVVEEKPLTPEKAEEAIMEIPEADVMLVAQQAGVTPEEARRALVETEGDLAKAILLLKKAD
ncbi:MAG: nascent polypeptide-associated complex protein [Candidatus Freyarchaeota archaeon]|mgnify:CR=1 FL=1|nr:nascent polypeptide-associated complex protein [Candidatus Freyrarchaeum guaymaensis]